MPYNVDENKKKHRYCEVIRVKKKDMRRARARARAAIKRRNKKKHGKVSTISILGVLMVCLVSALLLSHGAVAGGQAAAGAAPGQKRSGDSEQDRPAAEFGLHGD